MNERPILFNGDMVRAILSGAKTQTRRVVKESYLPIVEECLRVNGKWVFDTMEYELTTPFGRPGDRLWVRHTHWRGSVDTDNEQVWDEFTRTTRWKVSGREIHDHALILDENGKHIIMKKRPSIHMPRWASRINLEITDVRVERLNEIIDSDCWAEGVDEDRLMRATREARGGFAPVPMGGGAPSAYRRRFGLLWESINGPGSWSANPWVWVVEFKRVQK